MNRLRVIDLQSAKTPHWRRHLSLLATCLALIVTIGVDTGYGQDPNDPENELAAAHTQLRQFAATELTEGAELFFNGIPLQLDNLAVLSRNDLLAISANVAGVADLRLSDLDDGANIGLIFFLPNRPRPFIPSGFYLVRAFLDRRRGHGANEMAAGWRRIGRVELIDKNGVIAVTLPLAVVTGPAVTEPTLPVHNINLQADTLGISVRWNSDTRRSLTLSYIIPLDLSQR